MLIANLYGNLNEKISMETPMDLSVIPNKELILRKAIYFLVQSVRKFYEKLIHALIVIGFYENKSYPIVLNRF
jgi:hypothetical protein